MLPPGVSHSIVPHARSQQPLRLAGSQQRRRGGPGWRADQLEALRRCGLYAVTASVALRPAQHCRGIRSSEFATLPEPSGDCLWLGRRDRGAAGARNPQAPAARRAVAAGTRELPAVPAPAPGPDQALSHRARLTAVAPLTPHCSLLTGGGVGGEVGRLGIEQRTY